MEDEREIVTQVSGYLDEEGVELKRFKSCLKWVCLDQSNIWRACLSWFIFSIFTIGVPLASHFALSCSSCDDNHSRPYRAVVQSSLSIFATLSFVCLSRWARQYGLRRFLFLDKLCDASEKVQRGYAEQLQVHFPSSFLFFQSCFLDS
jgi:ABC-type multidrug transport system fused ATPase/permease subunit